MRPDCGKVRPVQWAEVRDEVLSLNPQLGQPLDEMMAQFGETRLHAASYSYGELLVDRGTFRPPCTQPRCENCADLAGQTGASRIPLALILEHAAEVFVDSSPGAEGNELRTTPLRLLGAGEIFGVFEILDSILGSPTAAPAWSVSSGARSVFVIAPLGDERVSQYIRRNMGARWAERTNPHWELVRAVSKGGWTARVLVFPRAVTEAIRSWPGLYRVLLEIGWQQSTNLRNRAGSEAYLRASFAKFFGKIPLGDLHHFATVRHLLDIASGAAPAFQPAGRADRAAGPFDAAGLALKEVLKTIKKDYEPVILQPGHLSREGDLGYYSFRCPSVPGPPPPRLASYADVPGSVSDSLRLFDGEPHVMLDFDRTTFFARSGEFSLDADRESVPLRELLPDSSRAYLNSPFFVAGVRIVRKSGALQSQMVTAGKG